MKTKWMIALVVLGIVIPSYAAATKPVSVELREARYTEEMKGDLDQAIKLYEKIAFNAEADRRYIAEAIFRLGACYAKKGQADKAIKQFRMVISQYADEIEFVAKAQNELAKIEGRANTIVAQVVQTISTCSEGDPRVKTAMDSLQGRDPAGVVTELAKHLDSNIDTIRRAAIYILWQGQFADIQPAVAKLTDLCKHPEDFTRGMAALAMGQNKVASAYDVLCAMTATDSSPYARRCGAYALGLLGKPEAKLILEKAAQDSDSMVSANAKAALEMLGAPKAIATPLPKATGQIETDEPVVIKTTPPTYSEDVSADLKQLTVTFNQTMVEGNFSWVIWDGPFPETTGKPSFDAAKRTCSMPVKLEPGIAYIVGINIGKYNSFQSTDGVTARPYAIVFATKGIDGKPTPIPQDLYNRAKQVNDAVAAYIEESRKEAASETITAVKELANDDGKPAGKLSISGGGHVVKFVCPENRGILRGVKIFGSRYGTAEAPKEDFHVWVCDDQNKVLKDFAFPYSKFVRGREKWVMLPTGNFAVPQQFVIFVGFNPQQTKGVYVHYDKEATSGKSFQGLPTSEVKPFDKGDWMIRAVISGTDEDKAEPIGASGKEGKLEAEKIRAQAWQLWNQQKFAEAEPLFQQAVEKDPTNANGWNGNGWTLFNLGRPEAAKEAFMKCIEIDPKQGAAWNGLGWIAKGQGQVAEAIKNWEQAVRVLPNGTAAMNGLAMTYMEKKDYAKAAQYYQMWLKAEPDNADAKAGLEKATTNK